MKHSSQVISIQLAKENKFSYQFLMIVKLLGKDLIGPTWLSYTVLMTIIVLNLVPCPLIIKNEDSIALGCGQVYMCKAEVSSSYVKLSPGSCCKVIM